MYKFFASSVALPAPISLFITPNLAKVPEKLLVLLVPAVPSLCKKRLPSVLSAAPFVTLDDNIVFVFVYLSFVFCTLLVLVLLLSVKPGTKATTSPMWLCKYTLKSLSRLITNV